MTKHYGHYRQRGGNGHKLKRMSCYTHFRRELGCGARQRGALVYAKHTPQCQTVKISEFIIVLPIIFLDGISSIWYYIIVLYGTKYDFRRCRYE